MYSTVMILYSDYCTMLMLNAYIYKYYTWHIYIAVAFSYLVERDITGWYQSLGFATFNTPVDKLS